MSKSKGKRFVLPKPSNNEDLNTDCESSSTSCMMLHKHCYEHSDELS